MESNLNVLVIRVWSLGFSSIAIGALALTAFCFGLARGNRHLRVALVLTCLSAICVLGTHGPFTLLVLREATGWLWPFELRWPLIVVGEALVGFLWLSVRVLFEDVRITPLRLAPTGLLMAISSGSTLTIALTLPSGAANTGIFGWLAVAANVVIGAHALWCVAQGWRGDLVEKRRRLRRPLLLVLGLALALVLITQGAEFAERHGVVDKANITVIYSVLNVALAGMALATGFLFLEPRAGLLAEPAPPPCARIGVRSGGEGG